MATQKKATKPAVKSTATKAKTTAAKPRTTAARKKPAAKKTVAKKQAVKQNITFMTVRPTVETAYWLVFGVAIIALGLWVLSLTLKINAIYDQIDTNNITISSLEAMDAAAKSN